MADRHTDDDRDTNRRTFLKTVGVTSALALGSTTLGSASASEHDTDLADEGLSSGDRIDPYLDGTISNETVLIPPGEYQWDGALPYLDNGVLKGHPDGVVFHRPPEDTQVWGSIRYDGDSRMENITIRGRAGSRVSRLGLFGESGAHITIRNVNQPDGSRDYSDAFAHGGFGNDGSVTFERCYWGDFGNCTCYIETQNGDAVFRECVFENPNQGARPPEGYDAIFQDCVFIWNGDTNYWCEEPPTNFASSCGDCTGGCGRLARGMRVKHPIDRLEITGCRFYMGEGDISYGPHIYLPSSSGANEAVIDDCYFYNQGDSNLVVAGGSWVDTVQASNLYTAGDGAGLDLFSEARAGEWSNPDLSDVSVWHTADGSRDPSVAAADPEPNVPPEAMGDGSSGDEEDEDPLANRFVVMSTTANATLEYRFWVDGDVTLETSGSAQYTAESGDESVGESEDLTVVTGSTGNQYGDAFQVDGDVLAFERTAGESDYELLDDGTDVTDDVPEQLPNDEEDPLAGQFVVLSTTSGDELEYQFWVDGDASLVTDTDDGTAAEEGDEQVTTDGEYTRVSGSTGNQYGDAFEVNSHVVAFEKTAGGSGYRLLNDGEDVTDSLPEQLPEEDDGSDGSPDEFGVVASTPGEQLTYRFVADGPIEAVTDPVDSTMAAEPSGNDGIAQRDDGLYEAMGHTGNQYGDTYAVDGEVLMFERTAGNSDWSLLLNDQDVTASIPEQLPEEDDGGTASIDEFTIVATSVSEQLTYRFVADGPVDPLTDMDDSTLLAEPSNNDDVTQRDDGLYEVTGHTGNQYGDSYAVDGEVLVFERIDGNSDWALLADGQDVTADVPAQLSGDGDE